MWREGGGNDGLLPGLQLASFDPVLSRVRVSRDPNVIPAAGTKNTLVPEPQAVGPHSTFQRAPDGSIHNYETYEQNPTTGKLDRKLRYRGTGKPHGKIDTPYVLERNQGKGPGSTPRVARPALPNEIPKAVVPAQSPPRAPQRALPLTTPAPEPTPPVPTLPETDIPDSLIL
jgi:hypothetical protein